MNLCVLPSVHRQLRIVIACVWRAVSWLFAHGLAPAYEERLGSGTGCTHVHAFCPPVLVWKGAVFFLV